MPGQHTTVLLQGTSQPQARAGGLHFEELARIDVEHDSSLQAPGHLHVSDAGYDAGDPERGVAEFDQSDGLDHARPAPEPLRFRTRLHRQGHP